MEKVIKTIAQLNLVLGGILIIAPMAFLGMYASGIFTPRQVFAENAERETEIITGTQVLTDTTKNDTTVIEDYHVFDVPTDAGEFGNRLVIPSIGVDTTIWENQTGVQALDKRVWRMPYHGAPDRNSDPIVLAAHRWGEDHLSWEYRKQNLFLNLPEVKVGQEIKLTWFGEEYKYRVIHTEINSEVSRIDDLILMTCQSYHSPQRVFVYAEKI